MQSAKPVRLAAGGMLFCDEKWAKGFLGQDGNRLAAGRSLLQGLASTPRRRGVPFTRVCRRGLRSMSGHPAYAWGNPPTLRRSSFPQRALRPAGGPYQNTLGAVSRDPLTLKLRLDTNDVNIVRTAPQIRSQGACGAFYFGFSRNRIKITPYKRRRVGRNLRLSRADPALCSGQPSPLRCILLSPQGLATLRGPRLYGAYRRVGVSGSSPSDFWLLFFTEK